ncbi:hypothetical protein FOL47_000534 [Perkinsus chesapeaki]|uniref:Immunoglobulin super DCC subclass member n=1 Tax=Perkinsus chesapeaki TaxID=330153 RepID=A0A7J6N105_PERCH|nr:hypothetical protein FOL47_000534 [Perkinsus chesapeaki]
MTFFIVLLGLVTIASADGKCTPGDIAVIHTRSKFAEYVYYCGHHNWGSSAPTTNCVVKGCGISDGCGACFGEAARCGISCALRCALFGKKPSDQACQDCLNSRGCNQALVDCTGASNLPPPPSEKSLVCG